MENRRPIFLEPQSRLFPRCALAHTAQREMCVCDCTVPQSRQQVPPLHL